MSLLLRALSKLFRESKSVVDFAESSKKMSTEIKYPHEWAPFVEVHKEVENSVKAGYDPGTKTWKPHGSLEGGTPTIAYGHKLEQRDIDNGDIFIKGVPYPVWGLPDDMATALLIQDLREAEAVAFGQWNTVNTDILSGSLSLKYRAVLTAVVFNAGGFLHHGKNGWPKLFKAIRDDDEQRVREEMLTSYHAPNGMRIYLTQRRDAIADAIGLATSTS